MSTTHLHLAVVLANNGVPTITLKVLSSNKTDTASNILRAAILEVLRRVGKRTPATEDLLVVVLDDLLSAWPSNLIDSGRNTHIIAPPNSSLVRAANTPTLSRARAITRLTAQTTKVIDALLDATRVAVRPGSTAARIAILALEHVDLGAATHGDGSRVVENIVLGLDGFDGLDGVLNAAGDFEGLAVGGDNVPDEIDDFVAGDGGFDGSALGVG